MPFSQEKSSASVLALHGFTGTGGDFEFLRTFAPAGTRFDAPDIPPLPLAELCAFLRERWENLAGTPRVLLGYSMGGRIALHLALNGKISWRKRDFLALVSASPGIADARERAERRQADASLAEKVERLASAEKFYEEWRRTPLISSQERLPSPWRERLRERRARADFRIWAAHLRLLGTGTLPPLWESLPRCAAPRTLFVVGEEDAKFRRIAEKMLGLTPRSRLSVVPASGHSPHLENAEAVARELFSR